MTTAGCGALPSAVSVPAPARAAVPWTVPSWLPGWTIRWPRPNLRSHVRPGLACAGNGVSGLVTPPAAVSVPAPARVAVPLTDAV